MKREKKLGGSAHRAVACFLALACAFAVLPQRARAEGQVYYSIDMTDEVYASGIAQKIRGDCAVVSVCTIEAYFYGATSDADKETVYQEVIKTNQSKNYANWGRMGYVREREFSLQAIYDQLAMGYPVIAFRIAGSRQHWSVVTGYVGSTEKLEESGFRVVNLSGYDEAPVIKETFSDWSEGYSVTEYAWRKAGMQITSLPGLHVNARHPMAVHQTGASFGVYGSVASDKDIAKVTLQVLNTGTGEAVFDKTVDVKAKSYNLVKLDKEVTFSKLPEGSYSYMVTAEGADGTVVKKESPFVISAEWPAEMPVTPETPNEPDAADTPDEVENPDETAWKNPFTDVAEGEYHYDAVKWALENNVTQGISDTSFNPDGDCTRAQVVTFLWRAKGRPEPKSTDNPFEDVLGDWYLEAMAWAVENGVTTGLTETTFGPAEACTCGQIVTFIYRAFYGLEASKGDGSWYEVAWSWMLENGYDAGMEVSVDGKCTRAMTVTFLSRALAESA